MTRQFIYKTRIYYSDTDALLVVYHGWYLALFERARTEALREMGLTVTNLQKEHNTLFAARKVTLEYLRPLRLDDSIRVTTEITEVRISSVTFVQRIALEAEPDVVCSELSIKLVCVGNDFKPHPLPDWLNAEFSR